MQAKNWSGQLAPTLEHLEQIAAGAYKALPARFREMTNGVTIRVQEFPDQDVLQALGLESEFDILGLFQGVGMAHDGAVPQTGQMPNMIFLYRRPILDYWAENEDTLDAIVTHVLVHEIGHHFGLSDEDMEAIEAASA